MKSLFATAALSLLSIATVVASTPRELIERVGVIESENGDVKIVAAPTATLMVRIDYEVETFEVGDYARYAQRCLGIHAPLVAKSTANIIDASIALAAADAYIADSNFGANLAPEIIESHVDKLPVDITSAQVQSVERAAADAAEEIFWIRQLRADLLSGELGGNYYGGGLEASLKKLDEQELALTELFMGRTTRTRQSKVFKVALEGNTESYRVCRFSQTDGVVDISDVSADLVMLSIKGLEVERIELKRDKGDEKRPYWTYRVAVPSKCELHTQERSLTQSVIPLFEFGYDLQYVIPVVKK